MLQSLKRNPNKNIEFHIDKITSPRNSGAPFPVVNFNSTKATDDETFFIFLQKTLILENVMYTNQIVRRKKRNNMLPDPVDRLNIVLSTAISLETTVDCYDASFDNVTTKFNRSFYCQIFQIRNVTAFRTKTTEVV